MNKSIVGSAFIIASSILFSARYIVASAAFITYDELSSTNFAQILGDTGTLLTLSILALIVGAIILLLDFFDIPKKK